MYFVYILKSQKSGILYKDSSHDLKARFLDHNSGKVKSTRAHRPWQLIYYEAFVSKTDTLQEELFLKSGKSRERIHYLLKDTVSRRDGRAV